MATADTTTKAYTPTNSTLLGIESDIPRSVAHAAHAGTSFSPERRAEQEQEGYAETLRSDYEQLRQVAENNGTLELLDEQFIRYRLGYKRRTLEYLGCCNGWMSTMITGGSNFPVRRMEKKGDAVHKRLNALVEFRRRALEAIRRVLVPSARPIMAGDADAVARLQEKIAEAEKLQATMRAANAAIRKHKKAGPDAQVAALVPLGIKESRARNLLEPDFCGRIGFPDYALQNNNANIRRMKERLAGLERTKVAVPVEAKGEHATYEDCPADNRVRLFFPGKPDEAIRSRLKSNGFRWTPSLGCWQAYRNDRSHAVAKEVAGV